MVDSCVILCGGKSSRLRGENGENKILLPFGKMPLIAYNFAKMQKIFKRVFIACKDNQRDLIEKSLIDLSESAQFFTHPLRHPNAREGEDSRETPFAREGESMANQSDIFIIESAPIFAPQIHAPIVGIISAFLQIKDEKIFFISCDCPFVAPRTIESLCNESQGYDIVFAKDSRQIHPLIAVWSKSTLPLLQDSLKKGDFKLQNAMQKTHTKSLTFDETEFLNINTRDDYKRALAILG